MKNILITWHNPREGVSSLKYILEVFASEISLPSKFKLNKVISVDSVFDQIEHTGFVFDEIVYITTNDEVIAKFARKPEVIDWKICYEDFLENGLKETFNLLIAKRLIQHTDNENHPIVQERYQRKLRQYKKRVWRNIQAYNINDQLDWMQRETNSKSIYNKTPECVTLNV